MKQAKFRRINEGLSSLLNRADRDYLARCINPEQFARDVAWELRTAGYCTGEEYTRSVLPYLLQVQDYLEQLRQTALSGEKFGLDDVVLFSDKLKVLGSAIRKARKEKHWTQEQLASRAGTFQPVVSRVERGEALKQPSLDLLDRFAHALGKRLIVNLADVEAEWPAQPSPRSQRTVRTPRLDRR